LENLLKFKLIILYITAEYKIPRFYRNPSVY
jgi:hypothetical protein